MEGDARDRLIQVGRLLLNQERAQVLVEPRAREKGFWFGGGNIALDADGILWLVGRYRNGGDARRGLEAGARGAELALMRSADGGHRFEPGFSLFKDDLASEQEPVLSIEGACLCTHEDRVELYVSSEKLRPYPVGLAESQKPGTGVWGIDLLSAPTVEALAEAEARPVLRSDDPLCLHVKDPVVFELDGQAAMLFCWHPFSWASSNAGYAEQMGPAGAWEVLDWSVLPRGPAWDVAVTRMTCRLPLPTAGMLPRGSQMSLYFYDGAECIHDHGGSRARGYSCEEVGGLAAGWDEQFPDLERLSLEEPLSVSPHGTGCSRYASVFDAGDFYIATWQQSQPDLSQPLVVNRVPKGEVIAVLTA